MNMNCYFVAVFACCREIYSQKIHCKNIGAISKIDAEAQFQAKDALEDKKIL